MSKLTKLTVKFISLVDRPANKRDIIWKSADEVLIPIEKVDDEQRMVYGVVYSPESPDTDGDWADAETIKQAAYEFMRAGRTENVDEQHDFVAGKGYIAESWILRSPDPLFPEENEGAWCVGIKVVNDETWDLIKSGDIGGISLAGFARREETKTNKTGGTMRLIQWVKEKFTQKGVADSYNARQVSELTWALVSSFENILQDDTITDKKSALKEDVSEFMKILDEITTKAIRDNVALELEKAQKGEQSMKEKNQETPDITQETEELKKAQDELRETIDELQKTIGALSDRLTKIESTPNQKFSDEVEGVEKKHRVWI